MKKLRILCFTNRAGALSSTASRPLNMNMDLVTIFDGSLAYTETITVYVKEGNVSSKRTAYALHLVDGTTLVTLEGKDEIV
jgi:hypothetical protein